VRRQTTRHPGERQGPRLLGVEHAIRGRIGMGIVTTVIVGGIIGWLASIVMKANAQMGIIANVLVGIVGASLGGWLAGAIGFAPQGTLALVIVAIAGASLLIVLLRAVGILK
jgi:uncharacterized membrane protein YeaQ/YmgE (transglycosylase-associated protein family)